MDDRSTARDIYAQWPGLESKYHAYQYTCGIPKGADTLKVGIYTQGVPLFDIPIFQNEKPAERRTVGLCMKNSFGHLSPERLVEWFEMHRMVGVEHFMMFDSAVHGAARQALQYYENIGVADVISFPFFHIMHQVMRDNHGATLDDEYQLPQQVFLVSINECLYRYRTQFKYILVLDLDEVLVPRHHDKLTNIIHAISTEQPGSAGYMFRTAWHLHEMGPVQDKSIPSYLHMQRYNKRTAIMELQPKSIFNTDLCAAVNWHSVTNRVEGPYAGNILVDNNKYGLIHHFRSNCAERIDETRCQYLIANPEYDKDIPSYRKEVEENVKQVLQALKLLT